MYCMYQKKNHDKGTHTVQTCVVRVNRSVSLFLQIAKTCKNFKSHPNICNIPLRKKKGNDKTQNCEHRFSMEGKDVDGLRKGP